MPLPASPAVAEHGGRVGGREVDRDWARRRTATEPVLSTVTVIVGRRERVAGVVGGHDAEVVVAVGLGGRVPARRLARPGADACRRALEHHGRDAGAAGVGRVAREHDRSPPTSAPFAGDVTAPVGAVASTAHVKVTSVASRSRRGRSRAPSGCASRRRVTASCTASCKPTSRRRRDRTRTWTETPSSRGRMSATGSRSGWTASRGGRCSARSGRPSRCASRASHRRCRWVRCAHLERVRRLCPAPWWTAGSSSPRTPRIEAALEIGAGSDAVNVESASVELVVAGGVEVIVVFGGPCRP